MQEASVLGELPFTSSDFEKAKGFAGTGNIRNVIFFDGTYQIEVRDDEVGQNFWIFLQLNDQMRVSDYFCTCESAEQTGSCVHLAAAFQQIFKKGALPIHVRFQTSLFNHLFENTSRRVGYSVETIITQEGENYVCLSDSNQVLFRMRPLTDWARSMIKEFVFERVEATEETSIYLSNLDPEEMKRYKRGKGAHHVHYALSYLADMAKWAMWMYDDDLLTGTRLFDEEKSLPRRIELKFKDIEFEFYIAKVNWPELIPSLQEVGAPITVYEFDDIQIDSIEYLQDETKLLIHTHKLEKSKTDRNHEDVIEWEDWTFRPNEGFFKKGFDALLKQKEIEKEQIPNFLRNHPELLSRFLKGCQYSTEPIKANYDLHFDDESNLHIECWVFDEGDLQKSHSQFFDSWVYVESKGFYRLTDLLFDGVKKVIPKEKVGEFVDRQKSFLNLHEKFQIHLSNIDTHLNYQMKADGIHFNIETTGIEKDGDFVDFGKWIYVKGHGFYGKGMGSTSKQLRGRTFIQSNQISRFINKNREDLEHVRGFFHHKKHIETVGLDIEFSRGNEIIVTPYYTTLEGVDPDTIQFYGDYVFVEGEGFSAVPESMRIPERYYEKSVIPADQFDYFLKQELPRIQPYVHKLDHRLVEPKEITLQLKALFKGKQKGEWIVDLRYCSEFGEVSVFELWRFMHNFQSYALTNAGLINMKQPRYGWMQRIDEGKFTPPENFLTLSTLDWVRLNAQEKVVMPKKMSKEMAKVVDSLNALYDPDGQKVPDTAGFESELRAYQTIGLKWLWYLYYNGLSGGLLCDEMGLGKTHQTMALLSAVRNSVAASAGKFIVVCPTSVIYHWYQLIERYIPDFNVTMYYGTFRNPKKLKLHNDVILTTYGVLRSDQQIFKEMKFEVMVMDEMQVAKNARSQINKVLRAVPATLKIGLTGTPIENYTLELKALFDVILPGYFQSDSDFKETYAIPIEKFGDQAKRVELGKQIHPFVLRRKKTEVLKDLPEKIEQVCTIDLSPEQHKLYKETFMQSRDTLVEESKDLSNNSFNLHVFALLSRLKQICDHPALVNGDIENASKYESGKWELFLNILEEARESGQKLVVFTQYLDMLSIFEKHFEAEKIGYACIRGSTRNRHEEINRFNEDPTCEVFIGSLQACGFGIDLTAASLLLHYDRWWNPAKEDQATDRVHRIGQKKCVNVYKVVCRNTIEDHIHNIIQRKQQLVSTIVGYDSPDEMLKLDRSELISLLNKINQDLE
ncbi:MAG: hypothetical protein S4CHLAM102_13720 [Chlamydiia bacterium]|nr:hypothetical protein [Chlamydiia bacterium]